MSEAIGVAVGIGSNDADEPVAGAYSIAMYVCVLSMPLIP